MHAIEQLFNVLHIALLHRAPAGDAASFPLQVALQVAYYLGNMHWAESDRACLILQLLGFPKARGAWDLALVRMSFPARFLQGSDLASKNASALHSFV